jgi:hypothetical protein
MKTLNPKFLILFVFLSFATFSAKYSGVDQQELNSKNKFVLVNPSHLDNLYEEINVNGKQMAIIHIYSDYPDYKFVDAGGEGIACIDDVARAAIFYSNYYKATQEKKYVQKIKLLMEYILYMQADNGYFYNFIQKDYSINTTYKTSLAQPDWWSWRAAWALSETYKLFTKDDPELAKRIYLSMEKLFAAIKKNLPIKKELKNIGGFDRPTWLQYKSGADQTSILVLALVNYLETKKDRTLLIYLKDLCEGIIKMQEGDKNTFPYNAFLSWENLWHAYGNSQSYALLKAYKLTHVEIYKSKALLEINYFYPYLLKKSFLNYFSIKNADGKLGVDEYKQFSQIAYGMRPMIFASLEAAKVTGDKSYSELAGKISLWFFGNNLASKKMYNGKTGICFDGINNEKEINLNSGAESTIEALLSITAIEQDTTAFSVVKNYMRAK